MTQEQQTTIEGIYEVCIGVPEPISAIQYWEQFGYRIGQVGELTPDAANQLYGVNSALRSIRLYHQNADRGLIRLMIWQNPKHQGLEMESMKVKGNRWATNVTADVLNVLNHAEDAKAAGYPIKYTNIYWEAIHNKEKKSHSFVEQAVGVRATLLLQSLTRQIFYQRFGYTMPNYGQINNNAAFKASEFIYVGIIIQDDSKETLKFYEEALGLFRVSDDFENSYESSLLHRDMFDLNPGEKFIVTTFDDSHSSESNFMNSRSGRLYVIRFPDSINLESRFEAAQPGSLGMCLYTYYVQGIQEYCDRIKVSSAKNITTIVNNEFGEQSFSFIAPDGYFWTLLEMN